MQKNLSVEFYEQTCKCLKADGKPCSTLFPLHHHEEMWPQSYIMTHNKLNLVFMGSLMTTMHNKLNLVFMGSLMTTMHNQEDTVARSQHKSAKIQKITSYFMHNG